MCATSHSIPIIRTAVELQQFSHSVLVPTMGGFHAGHTSLVQLAAKIAHEQSDSNTDVPVVVSIFVNPKQFDEPSDYERYPRVLDDDARQSQNAGATCVFAPDVQTIYPANTDINTPPVPQGLTDIGLEDTYRPGHLQGVWQVVHRLFCLVQPSIAIFGEKDWQQLQLVTQLAQLMHTQNQANIQIMHGPTIRQADGLALSSRNQFIPNQCQHAAASLSQAMQRACDCHTPDEASKHMHQTMQDAGVTVEYATIRDATTLLPLPPNATIDTPGQPARSFVAGRVGPVRILDNMPWAPRS